MFKKISILGSTGSVGVQTLDVISQHPEQFFVEGLAAGNNLALLSKQIKQFKPSKVSVSTKKLAEELKSQWVAGPEIFYGEEGLLEIASQTDADIVVTAVVGSLGLKPTLAAIKAGKDIGLANKETLVTAGHLVLAAARKYQVKLLPIDSEHSAIFQCLNGAEHGQIEKIILTASGGSFRDRNRIELQGVTVEDALKHPNWSMGAKITIDSATMVNKGLEVIEAHWLFDLPFEQIEVVLHPQSIVHSMVEFIDGSIIAQLGNPDMRIPIQYALSYPMRIARPGKPLDLTTCGALNFSKMNVERFPCLQYAYECGEIGGTAATVFNAANEIAVSRFLSGEIAFLQIERIIAQALEKHPVISKPNLEEILAADDWARGFAKQMVLD